MKKLLATLILGVCSVAFAGSELDEVQKAPRAVVVKVNPITNVATTYKVDAVDVQNLKGNDVALQSLLGSIEVPANALSSVKSTDVSLGRGELDETSSTPAWHYCYWGRYNYNYYYPTNYYYYNTYYYRWNYTYYYRGYSWYWYWY